jgi:hypothetical protein
MSEQMYKQAVLHKPYGDGYYERVAWIPAELATIGRTLTIDGLGEGWKVVDAGQARPEALVLAYHANARRGFPSTEIPEGDEIPLIIPMNVPTPNKESG